MADLPANTQNIPSSPKDQQLKVTEDNALVLSVHFLSQIYGRLGYIVKLLEEKK